MNSAAIHSAHLIAQFETQHQHQQHPPPQYPSELPFGSCTPGPFGGAAAATQHAQRFVSSPAHQLACSSPDAFGAHNHMCHLDDTDASRAAAPHPTHFTHSAACPQPGASTCASRAVYQPRALTQYDYPGGWGAQTFSGVGGLTQDSATRVATLQAKLNQRLGPEYLSQRPGPGGGKKLTYIEGWKLVDLANEVFGFNGWSTTIVRLDVDFLDCSPDGSRFNAGVSCVVRVTLRDGAFHEDIGYGSADNARQKHAALEKGKKEAVTDATKRALKNFGKLLGNCTYDHQYSANALKVTNPPPKFDASELHRRPELRAPQPPPPPPPPPPQPPQQHKHVSATRTPRRGAPSVRTSNADDAPVCWSNASIPAAPSACCTPSRSTVNTPDVCRRSVADHESAIECRAADEPCKHDISERQQRSLLARQAYLERQQAEARKSTPLSPPAESHHIVTPTSANAPHARRQRAAVQVEFGSDAFDDGLSDVLATYDETQMGEAEAASCALEMEIDEAQQQHHQHQQQHQHQHQQRGDGAGGGDDEMADASGLHPNHNGADDSGVAFSVCETGDKHVVVKHEQIKPDERRTSGAQPMADEMRRSTSAVKQVKKEAAKAPRRAGSVGRFISPPPPSPPPMAVAQLTSNVCVGSGGSNGMRNGTTSLSAASSGGWSGMQNQPCRRMHSTTLGGMGGVEGRAKVVAPGEAARGVKRPSEAAMEDARAFAPPPAPHTAVAGNGVVRRT